MKKFYLVVFIFSFTISIFAQENEQLLKLKSDLQVNINSASLLNNNSFEKKSPALAILYSVLLPGMGEYYAGDYSTGKYFTIADGIIWSTFAGMTIYGNYKEEDYRDYAQSFGSVDLNGKDDEYFANISLYESIEEFNTEKELNRDFNEVYDLNTHYWSWNNSDQRKTYRSIWKSSENAKNNVRFAVGALILNRIVSAIFAVRAVSAYNKKENNELSWKINFDLEKKPTLPSTLVMNFSHRL